MCYTKQEETSKDNSLVTDIKILMLISQKIISDEMPLKEMEAKARCLSESNKNQDNENER